MVGFPIFHQSDGREGPETIIAAKALSRRIIGDPIAGTDPFERRRLAVADLHETLSSTMTNVFGRRDGNPMPGHAPLGAKTRSR